LEEHISNGCDEEDLTETRKDEIISGLEATVSNKKKKGQTDTTIMERLKQAVAKAGSDDDEEVEPKKKKVKTDPDEKEFQDMLKVYKKYHKMKLPELKDFLRWNGQVLGGTKDFVLFKVIDGEL
jgi:hypothetical protein